MLELEVLEDDFVTCKFQKPLTFREFVSVKKHNWKPCKTSHLLVSPLALWSLKHEHVETWKLQHFQSLPGG